MKCILQMGDTVIFLTRVETRRYTSPLVDGLENVVELKLLCNGVEQIRPWRICLGLNMDFFLCVIGMVMVVEGIPYFAFPVKMKAWVAKILEMPEDALRRLGLVLMISGMVLVYLGKK